MRILVLGGYGLIGQAIVRRLLDDGHKVFALGRDTLAAARRMPKARWVEADLRRFTTPTPWLALLAETRVEAVVNAAGALQDGSRDDVVALQSIAMRALYRAAEERAILRVVQISATRAAPSAETAFMRSKGEADAALQSSQLDWTILRPGLVIARDAYGGTALLRALAAVPLVQPLAFADRPIQTVSVNDVAEAVAAALTGELPSRKVYDLVEDQPRSLRAVVLRLRAWLGFRNAAVIHVPAPVVRAVAVVADLLGRLGWRSPLRSTALTELSAGITGDPSLWRATRGRPLASLGETLAGMPATVQDRWFARLWLLKPLLIATLALFWIVSGLVGLASLDAAADLLARHGVPQPAAGLLVGIGALADLAVGLACCLRRTMPLAVKGMLALTLVYLVAASILAPELWADPLGPLVKAIPALVLALVALAIWDER